MVSFDARTRAWLRRAAAATLLVSFLSTGCGGTGDETASQEGKGKPESYAVAHGEAIEDCLIEVGVQFAVLPHDIAFFEKARAAGDVREGSSAYDSVDKVAVRLLVAREGGAKQWMLWYSQPRSSSRSPEYVVRHLHPAGAAGSSRPAFVAFALKPKFSFRKEIRRCVRFPLSPS